MAGIANGSFPIKIGTTEYQANVLTDRDYDDLTGYLQSRYIAMAVEASKNLPKTEADKLVKLAISGAFEVEWGSVDSAKIISTREGVTRLGWQMVRRSHPDVTFERFKNDAEKDIVIATENIINAYNFLNPLPNKEDVGGSSTENNKS